MINFINKFSTNDEFLSKKASLNEMEHFAAYTSDDDLIHLKNDLMPICLVDKSDGDRFKIVQGKAWNINDYPLDTFVPIGIVVVPASHGHYDAGKKCAIMSLNEMNCSTPQTGANSPQGMYWGVYNQDIASLPNLNQVPYVGSNGNVGASVIGQTYDAYLPSDHPQFNKVDNPYDTKTKYRFNDSNKYIPSPYNNDGTFNPNYSLITSPSSTANCLADFDGYNNTKKILEVRGTKDYSTWKPTNTNESDYPAASCCDMYSTYGTNQGEWYLPSAGELGYAVVRQQAINDTISKLISAGVTNASTVSLNLYWSSSEGIRYYARYVDFNNGYVYSSYSKNNRRYVRACRLV